MAYTNAWDETFPADTQLANQLGADIRNFKIDIRERLGTFLSDVVANRPIPEAGWAGLIFFATDTGIIYRWNGAAWAQINIAASAGPPPTAVVYKDINGHFNHHPPGGVDYVLTLVTLPANSLIAGDFIEIDGYGSISPSVAGSVTFSLRLEGVPLISVPINTVLPAAGDFYYHAHIAIKAPAVEASGASFINKDGAVAGSAGFNEDVANPITLDAIAHHTTDIDSSSGYNMLVKIIR